MLDMDLEFLKFLLEPTYNYIKDDIKIIETSYLKDISNKKQKEKINNFNDINYLFLTQTEELKTFLTSISSSIVQEAFISLANFFSINLNNKIEPNNFIGDILREHGLNFIGWIDKDDIIILKKDIRNYLINVINTTTNNKDKSLALNALEYLSKLLNKIDKINKVLEPGFTLINNIKEKRTIKSHKILKQIIKEHSYLLSEEKRLIVSKSDEFNVIEILKNEETFNIFFKYLSQDKFEVTEETTFTGDKTPFILGELLKFKYNNSYSRYKRLDFLIDKGIDIVKENIDINDIDTIIKRLGYKYISNDITYEGKEIIEILEKDLKRYNELYKNECEDYIFTITKEELNNKITDYIIRSIQKNKSSITPEILIKYSNNITEKLFNYMKENKNVAGFVSTLKIINSLKIKFHNNNPENIRKKVETLKILTIFPLRSMEVTDKKQIISDLYYTLSHELGHVYTPQNNTPKKYDLFYEVYNDYRSDKKVFNLLCNGYFYKEGFKELKSNSIYSKLSFFLIDIFEEYQKYFDECLEINSTKPIKELIGKENFDDMIELINNFNFKNAKDENQIIKYIEDERKLQTKIRKKIYITRNPYDNY